MYFLEDKHRDLVDVGEGSGGLDAKALDEHHRQGLSALQIGKQG